MARCRSLGRSLRGISARLGRGGILPAKLAGANISGEKSLSSRRRESPNSRRPPGSRRNQPRRTSARSPRPLKALGRHQEVPHLAKGVPHRAIERGFRVDLALRVVAEIGQVIGIAEAVDDPFVRSLQQRVSPTASFLSTTGSSSKRAPPKRCSTSPPTSAPAAFCTWSRTRRPPPLERWGLL